MAIGRENFKAIAGGNLNIETVEAITKRLYDLVTLSQNSVAVVYAVAKYADALLKEPFECSDGNKVGLVEMSYKQRIFVLNELARAVLQHVPSWGQENHIPAELETTDS